MKRIFIVSFAVISLISCTPDEHSASAEAPAAYIPPPENVGPAPSQGSGEWIGPKGFED